MIRALPSSPSTKCRSSSSVRVARRSRCARATRIDYEYIRNGTCNVFVVVEPLRGWRHLAVTEHRGNADFAAQMRWLIDEAYPNAQRIRVVLDNLSTHKPSALYEVFPPRKRGASCASWSFTTRRSTGVG